MEVELAHTADDVNLEIADEAHRTAMDTAVFTHRPACAQVLAEHITKVRNVYFKEEFGSPEAIWELEVTGFPAVVTMDSHNNSLHAEVAAASQAVLDEYL